MANTRITLSMPADDAQRLREKLATMTPEQINVEFGVTVLSVNFPSVVELECESDVEMEKRTRG